MNNIGLSNPKVLMKFNLIGFLISFDWTSNPKVLGIALLVQCTT